MKIASQRGFWSLRPTLLELGCWLAAGCLAVALAISPAAPAEPSAIRPGTTYWQQCIDRVLSSDLGMTEEYAVRQINRQCSTRRRIAAPPGLPPCIRVFVGEATGLVRRVPGCKSV
jgi:hypothetical protein